MPRFYNVRGSKKWPRENVIEGVQSACDGDAPLVVVSIDRDGRLYLASTGNGEDTNKLLNDARLFIDENTVSAAEAKGDTDDGA